MEKTNDLKKRIFAGAAALAMMIGVSYLPQPPSVKAAGAVQGVSSAVDAYQAVSIITQPSDVTAQPGEKVTFSVRASGSGLTYQWYYKKDNADKWSEWKGHTTAATSAISNVTWDGMLVRCMVTDSAANSVYSRSVKVRIDAPLQIVRQPSDTKAILGERTKFSVKALGSNLKYQWYFKKEGLLFWTEWKGHTTAVTSAVANETWHGMQLRCVISDGKYSMTTQSLTVSVDAPLTVIRQPKDETLDLGSTVTFAVEASGIGVKYRWYYKKAGQTEWNQWDDRTTPETTAKVNKTWEGMLIKCVITGNVDRQTETVPARITVNAPLQITTQPKDVCVRIKSKADYSVAVSGIGLKYQWYYKREDQSTWNKWVGHTSASTWDISDASWHNMTVKCIVTDNVGKKVTSKPATVTIDISTGYPAYLVSLLDRNKEATAFVLNYPIKKDSYKGVSFNLKEYKNTKSVPLFMQWDERWGYDKYGTGCIGTSGCGPTALSMTAMYVLKDTTLTPRKMAQFAIKNGYCIPGNGSSWSLMDKGGVQLGMKVKRVSNNESDIKSQLKKGHPIVAIMSKGYFTTGGHYIVFTNYVDGKIKINDSNSYINSNKLWKYDDIKRQIRNLWAFSKA